MVLQGAQGTSVLYFRTTHITVRPAIIGRSSLATLPTRYLYLGYPHKYIHAFFLPRLALRLLYRSTNVQFSSPPLNSTLTQPRTAIQEPTSCHRTVLGEMGSSRPRGWRSPCINTCLPRQRSPSRTVPYSTINALREPVQRRPLLESSSHAFGPTGQPTPSSLLPIAANCCQSLQ